MTVLKMEMLREKVQRNLTYGRRPKKGDEKGLPRVSNPEINSRLAGLAALMNTVPGKLGDNGYITA